jgi:hypothetical protein
LGFFDHIFQKDVGYYLPPMKQRRSYELISYALALESSAENDYLSPMM